MYDVTNLRTVKKCKFETPYTIPPKGGLSTALIETLQLQAFPR
jgi:hypothetical protein